MDLIIIPIIGVIIGQSIAIIKLWIDNRRSLLDRKITKDQVEATKKLFELIQEIGTCYEVSDTLLDTRIEHLEKDVQTLKKGQGTHSARVSHSEARLIEKDRERMVQDQMRKKQERSEGQRQERQERYQKIREIGKTIGSW